MDTATTTASLALFDPETHQLLAEQSWRALRRQTQELTVTAHQLLKQCGRAPAEISALATTTGPGSFTGTRIAIATVKGIGIGLPSPPKVLGLPTLMVSAAPWFRPAASTGSPICICPILQAGRGRYNWLLLSAGDQMLRPGAEAHHTGTLTDLLATLAGVESTVWLVGETDEALCDAFKAQSHVHVFDPISGLRRAGQLARLACRHIAAGTHDELHLLQPLYLRSP